MTCSVVWEGMFDTILFLVIIIVFKTNVITEPRIIFIISAGCDIVNDVILLSFLFEFTIFIFSCNLALTDSTLTYSKVFHKSKWLAQTSIHKAKWNLPCLCLLAFSSLEPCNP